MIDDVSEAAINQVPLDVENYNLVASQQNLSREEQLPHFKVRLSCRTGSLDLLFLTVCFAVNRTNYVTGESRFDF